MNENGTIKDVFEQCLAGSRAFAAWQLPGTGRTEYISAPRLERCTSIRQLQALENVFLLCPFETKASGCYYIPGTETGSGPATEEAVLPPASFAGEETFMADIGEAVKAIRAGKMGKVVLSRKKAREAGSHFEIFRFFTQLTRQYPTAFVSLVYSPGLGLWTGATPEVLLSATGNTLTTYSLAGTAFPGHEESGAKEQEEQQIVSDYITGAFERAGVQQVSRTDSRLQNGHLTHLLTRFSARLENDEQQAQLLESLHPTPAVAGIPLQTVLPFIRNSEKEARGLYAGFSGPWKMNGDTHLFVNLRCMQQVKNRIILYAGCGITADSDPATEWRETEEKMRILGDLL